MKLRLTIVVLLLLARIAPADELRIGGWNIEHLGFPDSRSEPGKGMAQSPTDLADYIGKARVDVLVLEEIGDTDGNPVTQRNAILDKAFELLDQRHQQKWTYLLFPKKDTLEQTQMTGVAWNQHRVQIVEGVLRIPVIDEPGDPFDAWRRQPHAIKFSAGAGKSDFVLVPLHMKSNRAQRGVNTVEQRSVEAKALVDQLAAVRQKFADDDLILVGDTNCLKHDEPALKRYADAGFLDLNAADKGTTVRGSFAPAPFDRILVAKGQPEFAASQQEIFAAEDTEAAQRDHKTRLSDHFLVVTTIQIQADDDTDVRPPLPPISTEPVDRHPTFHALAFVQNAAEYRLAARQAYRWAGQQLVIGRNEPQWTADLVQLKEGGFSDKPPAVILDLDETVLDNSPFSARLVIDNKRYSVDDWLQWVMEERADAIPGALEFTQLAERLGVKVYFVSNRIDKEKAATISNLKKLGFTASEQTVLTRNDNEGRPRDKVSRRAHVAKDYRIVLLVGDTLSDFCVGTELDNQEQRNAVAFSNEKLVGTHWVVIPNPMYGRWQDNIGKLAQPVDALRPKRDPPAGLKIVRLLPNPEGPDELKETVTIKNFGPASVDLANWTLDDDDDTDGEGPWPLSGMLQIGEEATFHRPLKGFVLNNNADLVRLIDPSQRVIHEIRYAGTIPGKAITPLNP